MTAIAVMKLLHQKKLSDLHEIKEFLPPSFEAGPNVDQITFRRLLTHRSGIRCDTKGKFEDLKQCIKKGVNEDDMKVRSYNNINFRLFRLLIPEVEEFTPPGTLGPSPGQFTAPHDYPKEYMAYVQKHVFDPAGLPLLFVKPTDRFPGLGYQFPCPEGNGVDFGDMTEFAGSGGWTMSSEQLATVFGAFLYTDKILPRKIVEKMKDHNIGLVARDVTKELVSYSHGGWYPGLTPKGTPQYGGEVGTLAYGLSNGVSVALIVNSQLGRNWNSRDVVDEAVREMVK
jgi:CubicO group peptidase (beta-lactamase class C family)